MLILKHMMSPLARGTSRLPAGFAARAGMQKIIAGSPALSTRDDFAAINNLQGIDVIATRLWYDR